jgi:hypothetical protein
MRRIAAARRGESGVQIMTLPQLAARLAGGFTRPARSQDLIRPSGRRSRREVLPISRASAVFRA